MAGVYASTYAATYPAEIVVAPVVGDASTAAPTQVKDIVVRLKSLDGWRTVGVDDMRGIWPEVDSLVADEYGSKTASFNLRRDPGYNWPDLGAFADVEIEVGGIIVWEGRISETPTADGDDPVINVQCEGWQFHLDDDTYERIYAHARLSEWRDVRSFPTAPLGKGAGKFPAGFAVSNDRGTIALTFPTGVAVGQFEDVGVMLDLGELSPGAVSIAYDWESSNNDLDSTLYVFASNTEEPQAGTFQVLSSFNLNSGAASTNTAGFTTAGFTARYIAFVLQRQGAATTIAADVWLKLTGIRVFTGSYQSAGASILHAPAIIADALDRATILLSDDRSGIDPAGDATFAIPEFGARGQRTPREVIDAANALHAWRTKVAIGRRFVFEARPAVAALEIGEWPGAQFDNPSANDGGEIYNLVTIEGNGADGSPLSVQRTASEQAGVPLEALSSPTLANPSFDVNTTSWTVLSGAVLTRDTVTYDSSPASGRWEPPLYGHTMTGATTGAFQAGVAYVLRIVLRISDVAGNDSGVAVTFGNATTGDTATVQVPTDGAGIFTTAYVGWTPRSTYPSGVTVTLGDYGNDPSGGFGFAMVIWVDSLRLLAARPTLVDRRGFRRSHVLPVKASLTTALASKIGDVWLGAHKTTPLKGAVKVTGDSAVRDILTGRGVPPEQLLTRTGDMVRLSHRVDPDTGGQGRDGRIAEVSWSPSADTATVAIDSRRTSVEALLERLSVVVGSG